VAESVQEAPNSDELKRPFAWLLATPKQKLGIGEGRTKLNEAKPKCFVLQNAHRSASSENYSSDSGRIDWLLLEHRFEC
jgi:hypothetical protein